MPTKKTSTAKRIAILERQLSNANEALEVALSLSPERDNNFFTGGLSANYQDRNSWDRKKVFAESLRAWRVNPLARRIVRLIRSFIIGKGLEINAEDDYTNKFLQSWWTNPLNDFERNIKRWKDDETRTGNLFFLFSILENGMSYIRAVPPESIEDIVTKENDVEQVIKFAKDTIGDDSYPAYNPEEDQNSFMVHFASNQPVGSVWGEADLSPLLFWIGRYSSWLEDRVRLNRFRSAFIYVVNGKYTNETERKKREDTLNSSPPKPGSILVVNSDAGETWEIQSAKLDSSDANTDGLAIKKMIASGVGFPLHYLAEPESSTRTTAEAAGTPTFRTLEEMQNEFFKTLSILARISLEVRSKKDPKIKRDTKITVSGPDITERDNATLALALSRTEPALADMFDRHLIDEKEFLRVSYKMFAEVWNGITPKGKRRSISNPNQITPKEEETPDITDPKKDEEK